MSRKWALNIDYILIQGSYWMFYVIAALFVLVYMLGKGYSNTAIGIVIAVGNIISVFAQSVIANAADRNEKVTNITVIKIMIIILFVITCGVLIIGARGVLLTVVYTALIVVHTTLHPFVNALNFTLEESGEHVSFGIGRSAGSFGCAALSFAMGYLVADFGVDAIPISGILILVLMEIVIVITGRHYRNIRLEKERRIAEGENGEDSSEEKSEAVTLAEFVKGNRKFIILSLGVIGLFFGNVILENFTIQIVEDVGGDTEQMGLAVFIMAMLEMPAMLAFDWLKKKFSYVFLIRVASVFFSAKIVMMFLAQSLTWLYIAQINQVLGYGLMFPALVDFIDHIMTKGEAVRGQAVFTAAITIGNVLGCVCGGRLMDVASVKMMLLVSSIISIIGSVIIFVMVKRVDKSKIDGKC